MKELKSPKHPDWTIFKSERGLWSMQHDIYQGYLIQVWEDVNEQWLGEIWTEQQIEDLPDEMDWMPAFNKPLEGPLEQVKAEVVRRGQYWANN